MKQSKEYKISYVLFCVAIVLFGVSLVTGVMSNINSSIDTICLFLGISFMCFGFVVLGKSKKNSDDEDK